MRLGETIFRRSSQVPGGPKGWDMPGTSPARQTTARRTKQRIRGWIGAAAVIAVSIVTLSGLLGAGVARASTYPRPAATRQWALTWAAEFNGPAGAPPSSSRWTSNTGGSGWGNSQLEYDTPGTANVATTGTGYLSITARSGSSGHACWYGTCRYSSGRLMTAGHFSQRYGLITARMKLPAGAGLWSAFWALDANALAPKDPQPGEIDVMENVGNEPTAVYGSLHGPQYDTVDKAVSSTLSTAYHVYSITWSPTSVAFAIDGRTYATRYASQAGSGWAFDQPFFLILDLAVGGTWPGTPPSSTHFPATLSVDYVRAYRAA